MLIRSIVFALLIVISFADRTATAELSRDAQEEIVSVYRFVRGERAHLPALAAQDQNQYLSENAHKCGMPAAAVFAFNRNRLDRDLLKSLGTLVISRPVRTDSLDSPGGNFRIHYDRTGSNAVYLTGTDLNGNGVPDYVDTVAAIFDSVYDHIVNILGYPPHIDDSFYPEGGDARLDVYISELGGAVFGLTYPDSVIDTTSGSPTSTAWIEIDNDFQEQEFLRYNNRPLDAVRVTAAHEYFHAVHFAIDVLEFEFDNTRPTLNLRYWMEMSATWMEEEIYDHINDYYNLLPFFFNEPNRSIQQFNDLVDLHPYASVVYPLHLSQRFGRDVVRDIWIKCGEIRGPNFLSAVSDVIDSIYLLDTSLFMNYATVFSDFAVWNFFTGTRSDKAPNDLGYSEKYSYPEIPYSKMDIQSDYPIQVLGNSNPIRPEHNAADYVIFDQTQAISYDSDSVFNMFLPLGEGSFPTLPNRWGVAFLFQLDAIRDSFELNQALFPDDSVTTLALVNPRDSRSITMILTPASPSLSFYTTLADKRMDVGFFVPESLDSSLIDSIDIFVPGGGINASLPSMVLTPYPNPAVVSNMTVSGITFRAEVKFDPTTFFVFQNDDFVLVVDIFNVAGEYIRELEAIFAPAETTVIYEYVPPWDMKNAAGKDVASGVYIAYARMYRGIKRQELLADGWAKLAVIR